MVLNTRYWKGDAYGVDNANACWGSAGHVRVLNDIERIETGKNAQLGK